MSNTGTKIVMRLKKVSSPGGVPTGDTAPNSQFLDDGVTPNPDYIPPYSDLTACPITYDTACPSTILIDTQSDIKFEFALPDSTVKNSAIAYIHVTLTTGSGSDVDFVRFDPAFTNYFNGLFTRPVAGSYAFRVDYYNSSDVIIGECDALHPFTI
jgi:hypothetical protein